MQFPYIKARQGGNEGGSCLMSCFALFYFIPTNHCPVYANTRLAHESLETEIGAVKSVTSITTRTRQGLGWWNIQNIDSTVHCMGAKSRGQNSTRKIIRKINWSLLVHLLLPRWSSSAFICLFFSIILILIFVCIFMWIYFSSMSWSWGGWRDAQIHNKKPNLPCCNRRNCDPSMPSWPSG
jgi:hypothetical protein